jgi:hypothetical protein
MTDLITQTKDVAQMDVTSVYVIIGFLIVMNVGAIGTGLAFVLKLVWSAAKFHSQIERIEKDLNAAHEKIRKMENGQ